MATRLIHGRGRFLVLVLAISLLALMAVGLSSCGSSGTKSFSKDVQDALNKVVDAKMVEFRVPGAIVGVWVPGEGQWIVTKGKANLKTGAAPTTADHVRIASITKTFTSTVILQLVDEGKVKLDDLLSKYDLGVIVPNADKITIRNLLNMTSGLFNYTADMANFWEKFLTDPTKPWTAKQLVDISIAHGAVTEPTQDYDYNNTNFILLGMIIEKVTGNTANKEITTRIIDKLGLKNTSFPTGPAMPSPYMHGYMVASGKDNSKAATKDISIETASAFYTAGGMISNLGDVKTWIEALAAGKLVSPAMHKEQLTFTTPPNTTSYGLGVMNGGILVGHSGEITGYNSSAYSQPGGKGATIIVLINRYPSKIEGASDQFAGNLAKAIGDLIKR